MKKHNINGLNIAEFGEESSKAIIFIHAFPFCNRMWDKQTEAFQGKYRVITYDLRGFGYSETQDTVFTIDSHVEDLFSIMNTMKLEKPVICGLSMGGYIALRALEQGQNKFKGAILCDTRSEADNNNSKATRARQIKLIKSGDIAGFNEGFIKAALSEKSFAENQALVDFLKTMMGWQKPINVAGALLTLAARMDPTEYLERIDIPVLVLVGKEDKITPPEYSKLIYGKIRNADLALIPDAGHLSNMENPEEFNKSIGKFLSDVYNVK
jgi:3-oxoadipate enol-lactonase